MIIKLPPVYDIAGAYQRIQDWGKLNPKPLLVIHKATEGIYPQYNDQTIHRDFPYMAENGIRRGAYHFFRKSVSAIQQAQLFCNFVKDILTPDDVIALDMEEGGETPTQIIQWLDVVEENFLQNLIVIYSNPSKLTDLYIRGTAEQKARLIQYPAWIAAYPFEPDTYSVIPPSYKPLFYKTWLWQYSSKGRVDGIVNPAGVACNVDCNLIDPDFITWLGITPPQNGDTQMEYEVIGTSGVNLRPSPSTTTTVIKLIAKGSHVWGVPDVLGWIKGTAYQEPGGVKTALNFYCVASLVKEITAPPPPVTKKLKSISIDAQPGTVVTRTYDDGTTESETA